MMLVENIDYTLDEYGNLVFTATYHLKRGYCCKNRCKNCPWKYGQRKKKRNAN